MSQDEDKIKTFLWNFLIVGASSSVAKTILAPLDRIKLILQNQNSAKHILTGKREKYANFADCWIRIPKEQGFLSFWRGNGCNVIRYIPTQALNFSFNDFYKSQLQKDGQSSKYTKIMGYLAGGLAGASTVLAVYPLKFCQTRLSLDMGSGSKHDKTDVKREYSGLSDCVKKIVRKEGFLGMYRGITLGIASSIIYRAIYFGLYDSLKNIYNQIYNPGADLYAKPQVMIHLFLAQVVTASAGLCVYPFDTVGRRIALEAGQKKELKLMPGPWRGFKIMYLNEGIQSFYKGASVNFVRSFCGALILVFYDGVLYYTHSKEQK